MDARSPGASESRPRNSSPGFVIPASGAASPLEYYGPGRKDLRRDKAAAVDGCGCIIR